jgi:hypothetical protein
LTKQRLALAQDIASGLAGWYQFQFSQNLENFFGEDAAQLSVLQIINAQKSFLIKASHPFPGYEQSQSRLDIAILSNGAKNSCYGALELKWLGSSNKGSTAARIAIIEDALRLSVVESGNMKANLLVVGGQTEKFNLLFGRDKRQFTKTDAARTLFNRVFSDVIGSQNSATLSEIQQSFPSAGIKLPTESAFQVQQKLSVRLLAKTEVNIRDEKKGDVYVWLCTKGAGRHAT